MTATSRLSSMLRWDVQLQIRYGFYAVYAVLIAIYVLGLWQLSPELTPTALTLVVFGDPAFLGFYFIAALVLFEKREGVLEAFTTSPLRGDEYLLSKALSLTFLALVASLLIVLFTVGTAFALAPFLAGVALTSLLFVFVGFVAVARFDTLNAYFMTSLVYLFPTGLPFLDYFGLVESPLFYLIPTQASLVLIGAAFEPVPTWQLAYGVGYLSVTTVVAAAFARRAFQRHIVRGQSSATSRTAVPRSSTVGAGREFGPVATLALADLKNWFRDPLLAFIAAVPLLYAVVGRFLTPYLATLLGPTFDIVPYYPLVVAMFLFISPVILGFVTGFLMLEEREQNVFAALWTTPLSGRGYLLYRGISVTVVSFLLMLVVAPLVGLVRVPLTLLVSVSLVGSLWAFGSALLLATFANNSVEGIAVSKFMGVTVMVPLVAIAVVSTPWVYLAGVLPPFWPLRAFVLGLGGASATTVALHLVVGVVAHAVVVGAFVRKIRP
ncbi:fluoroquinolone export ABC transporter permease subunit [Halogranum rubrum]|uniref:Uncharacterized protein n=1 Tax=Halogranum salarium B-1 TaxID=1210908 RepID=J2ZK05_9EURY|nr:ABC transporter permease [Halogranum salarium]EJN61050.1 hypothetical protein HSB1_00910 [Halogranum salarium B-1]